MYLPTYTHNKQKVTMWKLLQTQHWHERWESMGLCVFVVYVFKGWQNSVKSVLLASTVLVFFFPLYRKVPQKIGVTNATMWNTDESVECSHQTYSLNVFFMCFLHIFSIMVLKGGCLPWLLFVSSILVQDLYEPIIAKFWQINIFLPTTLLVDQ